MCYFVKDSYTYLISLHMHGLKTALNESYCRFCYDALTIALFVLAIAFKASVSLTKSIASLLWFRETNFNSQFDQLVAPFKP